MCLQLGLTLPTPGNVLSDIPPAEEVPRVPKLALLMKAEKIFPCIWRWICITGAFNGKIISEEISFEIKVCRRRCCIWKVKLAPLLFREKTKEALIDVLGRQEEILRQNYRKKKTLKPGLKWLCCVLLLAQFLWSRPQKEAEHPLVLDGRCTMSSSCDAGCSCCLNQVHLQTASARINFKTAHGKVSYTRGLANSWHLCWQES